MNLLDRPLGSVEAYVSFFAAQELPVLKQSVRPLGEMRERQDRIQSRDLAAVVVDDPLFAALLMRWMAGHRHRSQNHDITTVDRALMMMGVGPFFEEFSDLPTVETQLAQQPAALLEVLKVFAWTRRAAHLAREFATLRHDTNAEEVVLATLLRPTCDILLWLFAPSLAHAIRAHAQQHPGTRSVVSEHAILGCTEREILLGLAHQWHFPALLTQLLDNANGSHPRVRTASLATDYARHYAREGWNSPGLRVNFNDLDELLPVTREQLFERLAVPHEVRARWNATDPV